jgi:hypothetical protein
MNPVNWNKSKSPIDINSKPEIKVDERNMGLNTYRRNPKVDSNSSTSKLNNQSTLIKQASAHVSQNSGDNINHIKNSPASIKLDRKTSDTSETVKANQPSFTEKTGSNITPNNISRANSKEKSKEEKAFERKISADVDSLKVAVYRNNEQSKSTKIELEKFEVIAKELLSKSTKSQNIDDLLKFKSDLKEISGYLNKNIYSEIKNSLDTQLKIATTSEAVKNYNNFVDGFNNHADQELAENGKIIVKKVPITTSTFEFISRNILNESSVPISKDQLEGFKSFLKDIEKEGFLNKKNHDELKNSVNNRLKVALDHKRKV